MRVQLDNTHTQTGKDEWESYVSQRFTEPLPDNYPSVVLRITMIVHSGAHGVNHVSI